MLVFAPPARAQSTEERAAAYRAGRLVLLDWYYDRVGVYIEARGINWVSAGPVEGGHYQVAGWSVVDAAGRLLPTTELAARVGASSRLERAAAPLPEDHESRPAQYWTRKDVGARVLAFNQQQCKDAGLLWFECEAAVAEDPDLCPLNRVRGADLYCAEEHRTGEAWPRMPDAPRGKSADPRPESTSPFDR